MADFLWYLLALNDKGFGAKQHNLFLQSSPANQSAVAICKLSYFILRLKEYWSTFFVCKVTCYTPLSYRWLYEHINYKAFIALQGTRFGLKYIVQLFELEFSMETGAADNEVVVDIESSVTTQKIMIFFNYGFYLVVRNNLSEKKFKRQKKWLFSALNSWDMGVWSSNCFILNSLI